MPMIQETDSDNIRKTPKDDTNPFAKMAYRPRHKFGSWLILFAGAVVIALMVLLILELLPAKKEINDRLTAQFRVNEITALEVVARQKQKQLRDIFIQLPENSALDTSGWDFTNPAAGQLATLRQKAQANDDSAATYLARLDEYAILKKRLAELETRLGTSRLVTAGDTHFQMAFDFLISQTGKPEAEVRRILRDTRLQEPLLPGFRVWNFWLEDGFCTFVTQGDAPYTPDEAAQQVLQKQRQEKEQAVTRLNSLFLIIGSLNDLQARGILTGGFLKSTRLGNIDPEQFHFAIDLRNQRSLRVRSATLKLKKISNLVFFPREFTPGKDYAIKFGPNGRWVQITIFNNIAFRGRRIVIAVE